MDFFKVIFVVCFLMLAGCSYGSSTDSGTNHKDEKETTSVTQKDRESSSNNQEWSISSTFKSAKASMIGKKGHLGVIKNHKFIAGQEEKYMWHLWGDQLEGSGLTVIGTKKGTNKKITLIEDETLAPQVNGADASYPSRFALPTEGIWKLNVYVNEKYFGAIVVDIKKQI